MKRLLLILPMLALCGCSVVSANRVFPKLTWYWSADAKAQRQERALSKEWQRTNSVNKINP